jgi:hypothetical protein
VKEFKALDRIMVKVEWFSEKNTTGLEEEFTGNGKASGATKNDSGNDNYYKTKE